MTNNSRSLLLKIDDRGELDRLPLAEGAAFDSYHRQHEAKCLPDTRVDVLNQLQEWCQNDKTCIFWLSGMAGTGKSTVARTIAADLHGRNNLGVSFFFSRGVGDLGHAARFVTTLARQLADQIPTLRPYVCEAIAKDPGITRRDLRKQWIELVMQPISRASDHCPGFIIVIDALDECNDTNDMKLILHLFVEFKVFSSKCLGVIVTSRPETPIQLGFMKMPGVIHYDLVLHNVAREIVEHDIYLYLETEFSHIRDEQNLDGWPEEEQIRHVLRASDCLFIYAATVCRFVGQPSNLLPEERLDIILQGNSIGATPTANLDAMYTQVLTAQIHGSENLDHSKRFREVVGSIVVLFDVLSLSELSDLLDLPTRQVTTALGSLHSLLDVSEHLHSPIRLLHPSFRDYLLDKTRCQDHRFWVDREIVNENLAFACLKLLTKSLAKDICGSGAPAMAPSELHQDIIDKYIAKSVQYATIHWVDHLE